MALVDYFLKIEGVPGESADHKHKGEIQIDSFSFGAHQHGTGGHGGGGGSGKASLQDFSFVKKVDKSSPVLFLKCCSGEHVKKVELTCRKAGKEQQEYWKVVLTQCLVSSYTTGGPHDGVAFPTDQISLNFSKIELEYKEQKADGTLGSPVKAGWDVQTTKAV
jgi:type VI secretion system secreted protein Hcp